MFKFWVIFPYFKREQLPGSRHSAVVIIAPGITNFLVAVFETDLDAYNGTLCYSYPEPSMVDYKQEWMNCSSPIPGQFVQIMFVQPPEWVHFVDLDVYGY